MLTRAKDKKYDGGQTPDQNKKSQESKSTTPTSAPLIQTSSALTYRFGVVVNDDRLVPHRPHLPHAAHGAPVELYAGADAVGAAAEHHDALDRNRAKKQTQHGHNHSASAKGSVRVENRSGGFQDIDALSE